MMRTRRIYGFALLLTLAACAQSPTAAAEPEVATRLDGGLTYGGGNASGSPDESRGGLTYGGGNNSTPVSCTP